MFSCSFLDLKKSVLLVGVVGGLSACGGGSGGGIVDVPDSDFEAPDYAELVYDPLACEGTSVWGIERSSTSTRELFVSEGADLVTFNGILASEQTRQCALVWEYSSEESCSLLRMVSVDNNPKYLKNDLSDALYVEINEVKSDPIPKVTFGGDFSYVSIATLANLPDCETSEFFDE